MAFLIRMGRPQDADGIAQTVAEAFYPEFRRLSRDPARLAKALSGMVDPARFAVAEEGETGEIVGAAALSDGAGYAITARRDALARALGAVRGGLSFGVLKRELQRPARFAPGQAQVDFVGVRLRARGRGLARGILAFLLSRGGYARYTLDVMEGNERVLPLYAGLGFREIRREKEKGGWYKGFSFRYVMERPGQETGGGGLP
ncbi:MAG: GNAT family N-acetyltransferase [Clostridiales bacterium]|nr:GNAT family N-acetyltransferase [Clostridiales bacterium]